MSRASGKMVLGPRVVTITIEGRSRYRVVGIKNDFPDFVNEVEAQRSLRKVISTIPAARRPQERRCLCCGETFTSQGFHNRMCGRCRSRDDALGTPQRPNIARN